MDYRRWAAERGVEQTEMETRGGPRVQAQAQAERECRRREKSRVGEKVRILARSGSGILVFVHRRLAVALVRSHWHGSPPSHSSTILIN